MARLEPAGPATGAEPGRGPSMGWLERLGAALVAPTRALAASETSSGSGRAPADLAVLILLGFLASRLPRLVKAGWLAADGASADGVHLLLADLSGLMMAPLLFVVAGGIAVTLAAGRRRSLAADFDLACVAAVPLGAIPPVVQLAGRLGLSSPALFALATWVSYSWGAALLVLAGRQARRRQAPPDPAANRATALPAGPPKGPPPGSAGDRATGLPAGPPEGPPPGAEAST